MILGVDLSNCHRNSVQGVWKEELWLEERESGDLSEDRWALAEGWGVPAIAKGTIEPPDRFHISIVVVMPDHLLEGMPWRVEREA